MKVILDMTSDQIFRCQSRAAYQWNVAGAPEVFLRRQDGGGSHPAIPDLSTAGLPLPPRSTGDRKAFAHSGAQNSFYRETSFSFGSSLPPIGQDNGRIIEHVNPTRFRVFSPERREWLRKLGQRKFRLFITSIDWQHRNFFRPMNFWFLNKETR